ncbi:hypothetical protein ACFL35_12155 [Candidatus Riflebacteria bacterium]
MDEAEIMRLGAYIRKKLHVNPVELFEGRANFTLADFYNALADEVNNWPHEEWLNGPAVSEKRKFFTCWHIAAQVCSLKCSGVGAGGFIKMFPELSENCYWFFLEKLEVFHTALELIQLNMVQKELAKGLSLNEACKKVIHLQTSILQEMENELRARVGLPALT